MKFWEITADPASESNKTLFEPGTKILIKILRYGANPFSPAGRALNQVIVSSPIALKLPELIQGYITLELKMAS